MNRLIEYFASKHLVGNVAFFCVILLSIFVWKHIGKEEMPEFASNWIRVNTIYPGAPAEDVELFVTKPIEDEIKSIAGIKEVVTTSSTSASNVRIVIDDDFDDKEGVVREIKDAVTRVDLPREVRDLPRVRQFKSSEKAILDIGLYLKGTPHLDQSSREQLQKLVLNFENRLLALPEISSIDRSHYQKPEIQILIEPQKKLEQDLSLAEIRDQLQTNHIRVPVGSLRDRGESKVTVVNELEDVESLENLILRGNYDGAGVKLSEVATIQKGFEHKNSIFKINGHEGIFLNLKKSATTDILSAQEQVMNLLESYQADQKDSPLGVVLMDDESYDVVNRLNIVKSNGILGFFLILIILLIFLDVKSGFWVAMGIPFSMGFALIGAHLMGYTVNNMTLAGVIIVLGIVVDDAIIIAENIGRYKEMGYSPLEAAKIGAKEVFKPIFASIITTCVAFVPLIFYDGFFGKLVSYIPLIVILMLMGSLVESLLILPGHVSAKNPLLDRFTPESGKKNWFHRYEQVYQNLLEKVFKFRSVFLSCSLIFVIGTSYLFVTKMKYVMIPREESQEVFIKVKAKKGATKNETAAFIAPLEEKLALDKKNVVGVRSSVGLSRRGGQVRENEASVLIELIPADQRERPLNSLIKEWEKFGKELPGVASLRLMRSRWGWGSGSAIELQIQESDDELRFDVSRKIKAAMEKMPELTDIEIEEPLKKKEFIFHLKQDQLIRYNIAPSKVTSVLRSFVEGSILYSINKGEEEVDVRLTVPDMDKKDLSELLNLRVENRQGQLAYLKNIVDIEEVTKPINISRTNYKRTTMIYANLKEGSAFTPLQMAEQMEQNIFGEIGKEYPSAILQFRGEIEDSRDSQGQFFDSLLVALLLIYLILVIMFDSICKPFLVLLVVPFGLAGVISILYLHGMNVYGFFAVIGSLGMIGVVINDAIVMIDKIENVMTKEGSRSWRVIAEVASTRLRPVLLTTFTTVAGILPTAYGFAGYDSMLAEMMLAMGWGLAFGTFVTLLFIPVLYTFIGKKEL